jgi:hypothetical protein
MREGEIPALRRQDLDLERALLSVPYRLQRADGVLALTGPKTKRAAG